MRSPNIPDNEAERLATLYSLDILDSSDEERFDRITRLIRQMFRTDIVLVSLVDAERQWFKSRQGLDACETGRDISFCGHAILDSKIFEVPDATKDIQFADNPLVTGPPHIRFYAGAPLAASNGQRLGTLCIIDSKPRHLTAAERKALRDFADCIETEVNQVHERQLQHLLDESSYRSKAILAAVPDMVFVLDGKGVILDAQDRSDLVLTKEQLIGASVASFIPADLVEKTLNAITEVLESGRLVTFETPLNLPERQAWLEARLRRLNATEVLAVIRNITQEKADADKLAAQEQRLAGILEGTRIGTWEWDIQTNTTVYNRRWAEILGYSMAELEPVSDQTWANLTHPDDFAVVQQVLQEHLEGKEDFYDSQYRMRHKDGHWVWVHDRGRVITWTADNRPWMMYGTHADVSGLKETEEQLQRQITALETMNNVASSSELSLDPQFNRALQLGLEYLGLDIGIISQINDDIYRVNWFSAPEEFELSEGQLFQLSDTYCNLTLLKKHVLAIDEMGQSSFSGHPCYQAFKLEAYIGVVIVVADKLYGTLNFSAAKPRLHPFDEGEKAFVGLLARWVGAAIERERSQQQLSKLASQVPGMVFQYQSWPDGRSAFPYSSPGIEDIYGVKPEDVREDASAIFELLHPDDLEEINRGIQLSMEQQSVWTTQYRVIKPSGETIWVEGHSTPEKLLDGSMLWHGYIADITEQKLAEVALKANESRLRALFELSPIGIALNDLETGDFIEINESLLAPTGYTREEFVQLSYWEITPREYEEQEKIQLEKLHTEGRYGPYEKEYIRKDGSRYSVVLNGMRLDDPSGRQLIWSIIEDITERKRIESMKNDFVSTVSHELRTPLTSIAGSLGLVASGALGELSTPVVEMIDIARKNSKRLTDLINDLLDMDKLISGKLRLDIKTQNLLPLIEQSITNIQAYADQYDISLTLINPLKDIRVKVDSVRLEQVLANLLSNAIKFSFKNGIVIVRMEQKESQVNVSVTNRGAGIPANFRSQIFQKFAQADGSSSRSKGGTGLGLAISLELIERMQGRIGFTSVENEETHFFFELPLA